MTMSNAVAAMKDDESLEGTAPLASFLASYQSNKSLWDQIACGHHQNLFEQAVEQLEAANMKLAELRYLALQNPAIATAILDILDKP